MDALRQRFDERFDELGQDAKIILVTTFQERTTTHERLMEILDDIHSRDLTLELDRLVEQGFLNRLGSGRGSYYELTGDSSDLADSRSLTLFDGSPNSGDMEESFHDLEESFHDSEESFHDLEESFHDSKEGFHDSEEGSRLPTDGSISRDEKKSATSAKLQEIAQPVAEMGRVPREKMEQTLLRLCRDDYRTKQKLAELVQREPEYLQQGYLTPLVKSGRLKPRHPDRMTHKHQAYITDSPGEPETDERDG